MKVLCVYSQAQPPSDSGQHIELVFYLLLVNTEHVFPCLVELTASGHTPSPMTPTSDSEESNLNLQVREHWRRLGLRLMAAPSATAQLLLDQDKVERQTHAVRTHLEEVVQNALHHMRKDELWKRMLYGVSHSNVVRLYGVWCTITATMCVCVCVCVCVCAHALQVSMKTLMFKDFKDLLYLVKECPLEVLDPRLTQLMKQSRKWFKKLIQLVVCVCVCVCVEMRCNPLRALKLRFAENIRVYCSEDQSHTYAVSALPFTCGVGDECTHIHTYACRPS